MANGSPDSTGGTSPEVAIVVGILTELGLLGGGEDYSNRDVAALVAAQNAVLNSQIEDIYQSLSRRIQQNFDAQNITLGNVGEIVTRLLLDQDIRLETAIWDAANAITAWHDTRGTATGRDVADSRDTILDKIGDVLVDIVRSETGLRNHVTNEHAKTRREQSANILALERGLTDVLGTSNSILDRIVNAVTQPVENVINNTIQIPNDILSGVLDDVERILGGQRAGISEDIDDIVNGILGPMKETSSAVANSIPQTEDELRFIGEQLDRLPTEDQRKKEGKENAEEVRQTLWTLIFGKYDPDVHGTPTGPTPDDPVADPAGPFAEAATWTECLNRFRRNQPGGELAAFAQEVVAGITNALFGRIGVFNEINDKFLIRQLRQCVSDEILSPEQAIIGRYHGHVSDIEYRQTMKSHGLDRDDAETAYFNARQFNTPFEYLHWWHRGLLDEHELNIRLSQMRYDGRDIDDMKAASYFIPPAQDLITMAVREVFSPEQRAANRQDEDFPPDFEKFAGQQGISSEWARNYWAAHWALPSPQQGFEMFQRDVINRDTLNALLVALDVMPAWRDRLVRIAYRPIGRIDIRRIHGMGQISDEELVTRYRYAGYSPDDAQKMADFTIQYNAEPDPEADDEAAGLSRAAIINFYKDGLLTRGQAKTALVDVGVGNSAANVFLDQADIDIAYAENNRNIDLITTGFRAGNYSYETARNALVVLNLPARILAVAIADLQIIRDRKVRKPTKADLAKFRKAGLITDIQYRNRLVNQGYSEADAEMYRVLLEQSNEEPQQEFVGTPGVNDYEGYILIGDRWVRWDQTLSDWVEYPN